jgi:hypothetical protein
MAIRSDGTTTLREAHMESTRVIPTYRISSSARPSRFDLLIGSARRPIYTDKSCRLDPGEEPFRREAPGVFVHIEKSTAQALENVANRPRAIAHVDHASHNARDLDKTEGTLLIDPRCIENHSL